MNNRQLQSQESYYEFKQFRNNTGYNIAHKYSVGGYRSNFKTQSINLANNIKNKLKRTDQAQSLRQRAKSNDDFNNLSKKAVKCIAIASGKGGVGKTLISVNLALSLSTKYKKKVLLVDADLGLANADIVLGIEPKYSMQDCIFKGKPLSEVVIKTEHGLDLIAVSSGNKEMVSLGAARLEMFLKELINFAANYDIILFDCAAGIDNNVTSFIATAPQTIIVASTEPTSIMDVYALNKLIYRDNLSQNVGLIVNMADDKEHGYRVAKTLSSVSKKHLNVQVHLHGVISRSEAVHEAVCKRQPFYFSCKDQSIIEDIDNIAKDIILSHKSETKLHSLNTDKFIDGIIKG
ncbi:MinD/ParA family protein [Lentisphaerota bacterium WC36G]|nr:MinD/ParA family protein [Lentisphaerae bacterium WC36]